MPTSSRGAIELAGITKQYGKERVVDAVSVRIEPGEFFSLLGPSGSGKTTTLMMIAGFADVDEGAILVDGADVASTPPQKRGFGMVFQNYAIFPHLDVFENVAFPLRARNLPEAEIAERVASALQLVRLERFAKRFSRELSGGQQQRVAIARAIVFHPSVVLMDEPLGALDKNLRYQMQVEIKEIQRRLGMTVVYVTHDQEEAMNMSDRIAIMNNGRIEQVGRPAEIYENPATAFIARFLGEANLLPGTVTDADDGGATIRLPGGIDLRARTGAPEATGAAAQLFVRPERIALAVDDGAPVETGRGAPVSDSRVPRESDTSDEGRGNPVSDSRVPRESDTSNRDSRLQRESATSNRVSGRVVNTSFLGNILRYSVQIEGAEPGVPPLTVDVQNASAAALLAPGAAVRLAWRADDSVLLRT